MDVATRRRPGTGRPAGPTTGVVDEHDLAVGAEPGVGLEAPGPRLEAAPERRQGVLRVVRRAAPVGEGDGSHGKAHLLSSGPLDLPILWTVTRIKAECRRCGAVRLPTDDLTVRVCTDDDSGAVPVPLPDVHDRGAPRGQPGDLCPAAPAGCAEEAWRLPAELGERPTGPPLTPTTSSTSTCCCAATTGRAPSRIARVASAHGSPGNLTHDSEGEYPLRTVVVSTVDASSV